MTAYLDDSTRHALAGMALAHSADREPHELDAAPVEGLCPFCLLQVGHTGSHEVQRAAPRLSNSQLAHADMIAAAQHATRAVDALERALQRYTAQDRPEHALTRLRGRNALRLLAEAIERIDVTNGERFDG